MNFFRIIAWGIGFLLAGFLVFRLYLPFEYRRFGRLTPLGGLLALALLLAWLGLPLLFVPPDWPAVHSGVVRTPLAWIFLTGGIALCGLSAFELGPRRTFGGRGAGLKTTGIYALTRNPQLLGCGLYGLGFTFFWPSLFSLGWLLLFGLLVTWMVMAEEEHLYVIYGDAYAQYCTQVPRLAGSPSAGSAQDAPQV